jgi:hypothetical protein
MLEKIPEWHGALLNGPCRVQVLEFIRIERPRMQQGQSNNERRCNQRGTRGDDDM